jgi:predicted Zn-dependent peptidase
VQTVTVQMSWRGPALSSDSTGTLDADALIDLLNAEDSQLQQLLVDTGAFQSAYFTQSTYRFGGELTFRGVTTTDKLLPALGLLGSEIGKMGVEEYFSATSLAAAAKRRRVAEILAAEESASYASTIGDVWATAGLDFFLRHDDDVSARTAATIAALVNKYVTKKPYIIGVLTPEGTEQAVGNSLSQFIAFMKEP